MKGNPDHGHWDEDTEKDRCILRCNRGFEPSGCHVIRYNYWKEKWNHDVPKCQEGKGMSKLYICKYILTPTPRSLGVPRQQLDNIQHGHIVFKERPRRHAFQYMHMFINNKYMQTKKLNI